MDNSTEPVDTKIQELRRLAQQRYEKTLREQELLNVNKVDNIEKNKRY